MQHIQRLSGLVILTPLLALALGCGKDAERLEVHPVKGVVQYNGAPMKGGGSIIFFPTAGEGKEVSGTINEDGTFTLKTYEPGDGAPAGQYRVVVYQVTVKEPETSPDQETTGESVETVPPKDQIPAIYTDATRSPVTQEVKAGENNLTITLEAQNAQRGA